MDNRPEKINQIRSLGRTLDTRFEGPFGFRFGLDGVLGLIPGIGDFITTLLSFYIIAQAAALGIGPSTLIRMAINVGIENLFDMIPLFGNLFDFYWKSNSKNIILVENHLMNPVRETIKSRIVLGLILITLLALILVSAYVSILILKSLYLWITTLNR